MIKDQNTQEDSREIFKAVLEADYGQKFYDYVKEDKTDRGTYEVLLEAMKKYDFLPEDEIWKCDLRKESALAKNAAALFFCKNFWNEKVANFRL